MKKIKKILLTLAYYSLGYSEEQVKSRFVIKKLTDVHVENEQDSKLCSAWMKKLGVSKLYTQFKAFEDPNIILDVPSISTQLKINRIKEFHRQYEEAKN